MLHTLALLVVNRPTVLTNIASLISRRAYNIESIAAGPTEDANVTRITLVVDCEDDEVEQIIKQCAKLVDVIHVFNLTKIPSITRELAMIKVRAAKELRTDIVDICNIFRANIVDVNRETMVIELTGETDKIDALCQVLQEHGIIEIVRTGKISMSRGPEAVKHGIE